MKNNMNKIIINNLKIFAYHGVKESEQKGGQDFLIDCIMHVKFDKSFKTDDIEDTVSYSEVIKVIKNVVLDKRFNLIEKLASEIADEILDKFSKVKKVEITVKKPQAPIKANFDYVGVEVVRKRAK